MPSATLSPASSAWKRARGSGSAAARLHLDDPFLLRYFYSLATAARDLGTSYAAQRPIVDLLAERIPATLELAACALVLSLTLGIPLGVYAAAAQGRPLFSGLMTLSVLGVSLPSFVVGIR